MLLQGGGLNMKSYYIFMHLGDDFKFVATEEDVDIGGIENAADGEFDFKSLQEAELAKQRLETYCSEKGYVNYTFTITEFEEEDKK